MQETQETQVQSLGQEDPLEEEMATHSKILGVFLEHSMDRGAWQAPVHGVATLNFFFTGDSLGQGKKRGDMQKQ